jgi:hypothetical protein
MATPQNKAPQGNQGPQGRDIRNEMAEELATYPALHAFFVSYDAPINGTDMHLAVPKGSRDNDTIKHFLNVMDWVLSVRDRSYNEIHTQSTRATTEAENLAAEVGRLTAEVEHQKSLVATLQQVVKNTTTTGGAAENNRVTATALPHPTPFDGEEKDAAKRTALFQNWRSKVVSRWLMRPQEFTTELNKILYAKAMLEGNAYRAVLAGVTKIEENPGNDEHWPWKTGKDFLATLATKYATHDIVADAENQLMKITQKDEYSVFNDFLTEFTNLADTANWDDASKVRGFRAKLATRLGNALAMQVVTPERDDFAGWVKMAQSLATNIEAEEFRKKLNGTAKHNNNNNHGGSNNNGKAKDPDAIDLDTVKIAGIGTKEKERRRAMGLCFKCGQAGHLSRDCPSQNDTGGNGNRGGRGGRGGNQQQRGGYSGGHYGYDQNMGHWQGFSNMQQNGGYQQGFGQGQPTFQGIAARGGYNNRGGNPPRGRGGMAVRFANMPEQGFVMGEVDERTDNGSEHHYKTSFPEEQGNDSLL